MDTDDFSKMTWEIIVRAARVSDTLKAELGMMSSNHKSEDEWLRSVRKRLEHIVGSPGKYVAYWNLEEEEGVTPDDIKKLSEDLHRRIDKVLTTPLSERGLRE
jgi:hypothetical protein